MDGGLGQRASFLFVRLCSAKERRRSLVILEKKIDGVSAAGMERFVSRARRAVGLRGRVNVLITGSAAIRKLNREFRRKDKPTDVLSFPSDSGSSSRVAKAQSAGEIAISADIALQNSFHLGHPVSTELKILILHGVLHLAGFDHERDNGSMAHKEERLRRQLRLPVALIERTVAGHSARPRSTPGPGKSRRTP